MKAIWNGEVIAESDEVEMVEDYAYFPEASVKHEFLSKSASYTTCPWKGNAHYYHIKVGKKRLKDAAWHYPYPSDAAMMVRGRIAFGDDVTIEE